LAQDLTWPHIGVVNAVVFSTKTLEMNNLPMAQLVD